MRCRGLRQARSCRYWPARAQAGAERVGVTPITMRGWGRHVRAGLKLQASSRLGSRPSTLTAEATTAAAGAALAQTVDSSSRCGDWSSTKGPRHSPRAMSPASRRVRLRMLRFTLLERALRASQTAT